MMSDRKCLVANAYNEITDSYLERFGASTVRDHWLSELLEGFQRKAAPACSIWDAALVSPWHGRWRRPATRSSASMARPGSSPGPAAMFALRSSSMPR